MDSRAENEKRRKLSYVITEKRRTLVGSKAEKAFR